MKIELKQIQENPKILEDLATENQEIIITKNDQPMYKLTRINKSTPKRRHRGIAKGLIKIATDFDEPLTEFGEYI